MPFLPSVNLFVKERFTQKQVGFWVLSGLFLGNGLGVITQNRTCRAEIKGETITQIPTVF